MQYFVIQAIIVFITQQQGFITPQRNKKYLIYAIAAATKYHGLTNCFYSHCKNRGRLCQIKAHVCFF
jgi:hypothetical protein